MSLQKPQDETITWTQILNFLASEIRVHAVFAPEDFRVLSNILHALPNRVRKLFGQTPEWMDVRSLSKVVALKMAGLYV